MKRYWMLLTLVVMIVLSGCSYAPGNEQEPFIEKWLDLPSIELDDYQSSKIVPKETIPGESVVPTETEPQLTAPEVNLEDLPPRNDSDFVRVKDYIPDILVEIKYATSNNFTGTVVYDYTDAYLRYGTVQKLMKVQDELRQQGLLLKIWDSFRTMDAQQVLYEKSGGKGFSNPKTSNNSQSRGNTVDLTIVDKNGNELEMPTKHDEFNSYSDRNFSDCTVKAAENALLLQTIMQKHGFTGLQSEWWQFSDNVKYDVEQCFDPGEIALYFADCEDYINMRSEPDVEADSIQKIKADEHFTLLGWAENDFALVEYEGKRGYVNANYIAEVDD